MNNDAVTRQMKCMISQPMAGLSPEEIKSIRDEAINKLTTLGMTFINSYFEVYPGEVSDIEKSLRYKSEVVHMPLVYLAKSLHVMALCDAVYFCKGWENARGCKIERDVAEAYGLIIFEQK